MADVGCVATGAGVPLIGALMLAYSLVPLAGFENLGTEFEEFEADCTGAGFGDVPG